MDTRPPRNSIRVCHELAVGTPRRVYVDHRVEREPRLRTGREVDGPDLSQRIAERDGEPLAVWRERGVAIAIACQAAGEFLAAAVEPRQLHSQDGVAEVVDHGAAVRDAHHRTPHAGVELHAIHQRYWIAAQLAARGIERL